MAPAQAVPVVDISQLDDPHSLADAIKDTLSSTGFLFVTGHGLEEQAERMFEISGASLHRLGSRRASLTSSLLLAERFFRDETDDEKQRCAYADNKGYTKVSQEVCVPSPRHGPARGADARSLRSLDPTRPAPDLKEGFNTAHIELGENGRPPIPSQPLPNLLQQHAADLAAFQLACFSICQRLLQAFAVALDASPLSSIYCVRRGSMMRY